MTDRLTQLRALQRIGTQRLTAVEQRLAGATRTEREAASRCDELERRRVGALHAPQVLAREALRSADLAALRSLPEQRAVATQTAAGIDAQLAPARVALDMARQQRREAAHALQRQRVRNDHAGQRHDAIQRRLGALAADAAGEDALELRVGR